MGNRALLVVETRTRSPSAAASRSASALRAATTSAAFASASSALVTSQKARTLSCTLEVRTGAVPWVTALVNPGSGF
jgi:hypothetical protein